MVVQQRSTNRKRNFTHRKAKFGGLESLFEICQRLIAESQSKQVKNKSLF
jgi:hypothetical protein